MRQWTLRNRVIIAGADIGILVFICGVQHLLRLPGGTAVRGQTSGFGTILRGWTLPEHIYRELPQSPSNYMVPQRPLLTQLTDLPAFNTRKY